MSQPSFTFRESPLDQARREAAAGDALAAHGELAAACERYERAIDLQPENMQFYCQLGAYEWRRGRVEAGSCFERAAALNPKFAMAQAALSAWYLQQGLVEQADQASRRAMELAPQEASVMQSRAAALETMGDSKSAWGLVDRLIKRGHFAIPTIRLYGRLAAYQRQQAPALELVGKLLAGAGGSAHDRACLHFTMAELLDSVGRYDEAFEHARRGHQLVRPTYDPAAHERTIDQFIAYFTRERMASLPRGTDRSEKPVFIVGMPRSGTSLVEQIVASHPAVHGAGELEFMTHVWAGTLDMLKASPEEYPGCLDRLSVEQADGMAQIYLQPLVAMNPAAERITDKLPLNFLHLGLVALLLPGARVIDCRRDVRDICVSCYMTMFEAGNDFSHDLMHTAHFYAQSRRLMEHWKGALDLPILEVRYEDLVTDLEGQSRRMVEFLGLAWDERCLRFYESKRAVSTASKQQVRKPLYQSSVGRWRRYERHLGELASGLSDFKAQQAGAEREP